MRNHGRYFGTAAIAAVLGGLAGLGAASGAFDPATAIADDAPPGNFPGTTLVKGYVRFGSSPKEKMDVETEMAFVDTTSGSFSFPTQPSPFTLGCFEGGKVVVTDDPDGIARAIAEHATTVDGYVFDRVSVRGRWKSATDGLTVIELHLNTLVKFRGVNDSLGGKKVRGRAVVKFDGAITLS